MKERFSLLLSSQNATNRLTTTKRNLQYNINWSAVLPKSENINQKYSVRFTMSGLYSGTGFNDIYSVNIDFGGSNMYDQTVSKSNYLGLSFPILVGTGYWYSLARNYDNLPVCVEYPNNSLITVNLVNINTGSGTTWPYEYYLTLEFIPLQSK